MTILEDLRRLCVVVSVRQPAIGRGSIVGFL